MDFTLKRYYSLLLSLKQYYSFTFLTNIIKLGNEVSFPSLILRHDVDRFPSNALIIAQLEHSLEITGTYYFRIISKVFNEKIIKQIAALGHEIGYHYEDVDLVIRNENFRKNKSHGSKKMTVKKKFNEAKLIDLAYESFCKNLELMRQVADIKTISAHGSPLSQFDNKLIWKKYDYTELGIVGEPYLDIDWNYWGYLTDTGRRWNGYKVSVRDKVDSKYKFNFKKTDEIIINQKNLPDKLMINIHPHRWFDPGLMWMRELLFQNSKNLVKYFVVKRNGI